MPKDLPLSGVYSYDLHCHSRNAFLILPATAGQCPKNIGKNWLLDSKNHVYDGLCNCSLTSFSFIILTYVLSTLRLCEPARIDLSCWLVVATSFPMNESWKLQKGKNDCQHAERLRLHFPITRADTGFKSSNFSRQESRCFWICAVMAS